MIEARPLPRRSPARRERARRRVAVRRLLQLRDEGFTTRGIALLTGVSEDQCRRLVRAAGRD